MTYQLTVIYAPPQDPAAFDAHYEQTHAPLARKMPGLLSYTYLKPDPGPDGAAPDAYAIAELRFADRAAFGAAVGSAEGRAATGDVANFATGGVTMLTGEVTTYV
jgi:uncharacterized protein (TIGR02118 family)